MLHLIQLFNMVDDKKLFIGLFSGFKYETTMMGYTGFEGEMFNEMLLNHFGLEIECSKQLNRITNAVLDKLDLSFLESIVR